ncbi:MAG TPA: hypothetical protein PKK95_03720 [Vicinamibacterales bacterium]|nr:hypothetical protein [Vicinamibacterales bacterium]
MESHDIKRFVDWWKGDAAFRARFRADAARAVAEYGIRVDPDAVRELCEPAAGHTGPGEVKPCHAALDSYFRALEAQRAVYDDLDRLESAIGEPGFAAWRQRQRRRFASQAPDSWGRQNPHIMFAIELSDGCSIACPFCAGGAGRLKSVSRFTPANEALFRGLLRRLSTLAACPAPSGLLYHYTEPLDNPDYEKFLQAYREELGELPQTTTAAWGRRPDRTRRVLAMAREHGGRIQRFSVNSVEDFRSCMRTFAPEELRDVVIVPHYPEAGGIYYRTGRARSLAEAVEGSVACVSGFLVNLAARTIQLVAPCIEPSAWPGGYRSLAASSFRTDDDLDVFFERCREEVLDRILNDTTPIALRNDLHLSEDAGGTLELRSLYRSYRFEQGLQKAVLRLAGERRSLGALVDELSVSHPEGEVFAFVQLLWDSGLLADSDVLAAEDVVTAPVLPRSKLASAAAAHAGALP